MLEVVGEDLREGAVLEDRYRLDRIVGRGGMGVVWAATDLRSNEPRAIKLVDARRAADPKSHERLLREARAMATVQHPNVVTVFEVCELPSGIPFIVMELLEGETLAARLKRVGALPLAEAARILSAVASALEAAHAEGIVHRDLKPDNVFLHGDKTTVLDFGIAKRLVPDATEAPSLTTTGAMLGTPHYMAPEQIFGDEDVDGRADVWALGVVAYECLTGKRPTAGTGIGQVIKRITAQKLPSLAEAEVPVPKDVVDLVSSMLDRDRDARPPLRAVREILEGHVEGSARSVPPAPAIRARAPLLLALGATPLGILAAVLALGGHGREAAGAADAQIVSIEAEPLVATPTLDAMPTRAVPSAPLPTATATTPLAIPAHPSAPRPAAREAGAPQNLDAGGAAPAAASASQAPRPVVDLPLSPVRH